MATYLERYQKGDYAQVWAELVAAGDAVRAAPLYSDAKAVAQETMNRAKQNIDLLFVKLRNLGYEFQFPGEIIQPASPTLLAEVDAFEREVGPIPLSLRAWVETVGSVNFMGTYPRLSTYHSTDNPLFEIGGPGGGTQVVDFNTMLKEAADADLSVLPPQVANFFGQFQGMFKAMQGQQGDIPPQKEKAAIDDADKVESDPLVFEPTMISVEAYEDWLEYEDAPYLCALAPDVFHKANVSGGDPYSMALPNAAADGPLLNTEWGELTLVEYLRHSFAWAGFPGLKDYERRDEALLASLKQGLVPL